MKNIKVLLALLIVAGLSMSVFAWRDRRYMTAAQEVALYSLASRYIEAICHDPASLSHLLDSPLIPRSLVEKSSEFVTELIESEGPCFGWSKDKLEEEALEEIRRLPNELLRNDMVTEFGLNDFFDCLVEVENSFFNHADSTSRIFTCIETKLDIRGFWYHILVRKNSGHIGHPVIIGPHPIEDPISIPLPPPVLPPIPVNPCLDNCLQQCPISSFPET